MNFCNFAKTLRNNSFCTQRVDVRVTCVAADLITAVPAVVVSVTLAAAVDTGAVITLELVWTTSRTT